MAAPLCLEKQENKSGDERVQLIAEYMKMIISIVRSYRPEESIFQDLVQEGVLGLLKAQSRFDISMGNRFSTYATYWIRYYVRRYLSRNARMVKVPLRKLELHRNIGEIREQCKKSGLDVSDEDIAAAANLSIQELQRVELCNQPVLSFDIPIGEGDTKLYDLVQDDHALPAEQQIIEEELRAGITSALNGLLDKEKRVISRRFGFDQDSPAPLREIALEYGVSAETVRQIEKRAIAKLRERCADLVAYLL